MCGESGVRHFANDSQTKGTIWIRLWPAPQFRHRMMRAGQGPRRGKPVLVQVEGLRCESGCGC